MAAKQESQALTIESSPSSDAEAIITAVEKLSKAEVIVAVRGDDATSPLVVVPEGKRIFSMKPFLDEYLKRPERKKGLTRLTTLDSFIEFVERHRTRHTVVFLDDTNKKQPRLRAIFNAHTASDDAAEPSPADFQDFEAEYSFPLSDEWTAWTSLPPCFSQADFAEFLEDRISDVIDPAIAGPITKQFAADLGLLLASPAKLMSLSRGLAITVDSKVTHAQNLSTGEVAFTFVEEHKDGKGEQLNMPGAFAIAIPVFRAGQPYQLPVRLRYRLNGGRITWMLSVQRDDRILEHALEEAAGQVAKVTERPMFRGRVEK